MNYFPENIKNILITGGSGFIGSTLVQRLLKETNCKIYNLDKLSYASYFRENNNNFNSKRYELLKVDLANEEDTKNAVKISNPDLVFHLAAESHVDNSICSPKVFLESNIIGTYNLLEALRSYWELLTEKKKNSFKFLHVSTDEVFGSLENNELFTEESLYNPRSPYSATKAASDHLVRAWNNTYHIPILITNSCNNFGPRQFPEKLIPVIIKRAIAKEDIPIYGDGQNIREWLFVEDHIDALIKVMQKGKIGDTYCIGSKNLKTNEEIVELVCNSLDTYNIQNAPHIRFKSYIKDRAGHDRRYAIDSKKITEELQWKPKHDIIDGITITVKWYLNNLDWLN